MCEQCDSDNHMDCPLKKSKTDLGSMRNEPSERQVYCCCGKVVSYLRWAPQ